MLLECAPNTTHPLGNIKNDGVGVVSFIVSKDMCTKGVPSRYMKNMKNTKINFVIIAQSRVGSNMFVDLLKKNDVLREDAPESLSCEPFKTKYFSSLEFKGLNIKEFIEKFLKNIN